MQQSQSPSPVSTPSNRAEPRIFELNPPARSPHEDSVVVNASSERSSSLFSPLALASTNAARSEGSAIANQFAEQIAS